MNLYIILVSVLMAVMPIGQRENIWPKGKMPDSSNAQIAAMTSESNAPDFKPEKHRQPYLEWFAKPQNPNGTCMILISGGSYKNTCDMKLIELWNRELTARGVQCVSLVYRTPRPKGMPYYKTAWEDGQRAVRLVRSQAAKRGYDPERIGVVGMSAGGHLSLLLGANSQTRAYVPVDALDSIQCHINIAVVNAPAYVTTDADESGIPAARQGYGVDVGLSKAFLFDGKTCPMSLHHGGADKYSPNGSTLVYRKLRTMGIPAELHLYPNKPHGAYGFDRALEFLKQMGFLEPLEPEVPLMDRYMSDADRAFYSKEPVWPEGKTPDHQPEQNVPYIEWHIPAELKSDAIQIIYSGGGYKNSNTDGLEVAPARRYLNSLGMAVVTLRYRTPRPAAPLAKHTTAWQDLQRTIRIVRSEAASKGLNPNKIGIMGSSAGGHLTLMGVTSSRHQSYRAIDELDKLPCNVQWGIGIYPAYALTDGVDEHNVTGGNADEARLVPEFSFDPDTAPMLFIHGDADGWASMNSVKAWEQMRAMGVQSELHTLATRKHCFQRTASPGTGSYTWMERIGEFLNDMQMFTRETAPLPEVTPQVIPVQTAGTQLLLQVDEKGVLRTVHYGAPAGDPDEFLNFNAGTYHNWGAPDAYPAAGGRFNGQEALHVQYADGTQNTELYYVGHDVAERDGIVSTVVHMKDYVTSLEVDLVYDACQKEDVVLMHSIIRNRGKQPVQLRNYASASLRLTADDYLLTHFYGGWATEMQVDRELLTHDTKIIESRRGTQATQGGNPSFLVSLGKSFSETDGEVVAGALAWSGNFRISFERDQSERLNIVAGINPFASAYPLAAGGEFETPEMIYTWSSEGAGGASRNMHRWARKYGVWKGGEVNPTLLNSWEGAYFSFNTDVLLRMIDDAAKMGLEMFVLDDGWFGMEHPRNSDSAGLGDWEVNTNKLPEGIGYVASYAHSKGLKFGIWIEPEMVNPDSNLAAAHPEWIVQSPGREIYECRNQWLLDLTNPAVQDFVFDVFDRTMQLSPDIDYVKWDCNRRVMSFGSPYLGAEQDRFYVDYVQGLYKVCRRMREKYPDVTVQCCSSGGARIDYGSMRWFNEVWTSDNTDAISRVRIQYATSLIYPACVMGSHVSAVPNHQTGNVTSLKFRFDVAAAGRLGMELQPKTLTPEEKALASRCLESYKGYRDLVFKGDLYRLASPYDGDYYGLMYVSADRRRAVVFNYCLRFQNYSIGTHVFRLQGLDPEFRYKVTELNADKSCWWGNGGVWSGAFLSEGGFNPAFEAANTSAVFLLEAE